MVHVYEDTIVHSVVQAGQYATVGERVPRAEAERRLEAAGVRIADAAAVRQFTGGVADPHPSSRTGPPVPGPAVPGPLSRSSRSGIREGQSVGRGTLKRVRGSCSRAGCRSPLRRTQPSRAAVRTRESPQEARARRFRPGSARRPDRPSSTGRRRPRRARRRRAGGPTSGRPFRPAPAAASGAPQPRRRRERSPPASSRSARSRAPAGRTSTSVRAIGRAGPPARRGNGPGRSPVPSGSGSTGG
jgi:hypothetical protein